VHYSLVRPTALQRCQPTRGRQRFRALPLCYAPPLASYAEQRSCFVQPLGGSDYPDSNRRGTQTSFWDLTAGVKRCYSLHYTPVWFGHRSLRLAIRSYERKHQTRDQEPCTCSAREKTVSENDALLQSRFPLEQRIRTRCWQYTSRYLFDPCNPLQGRHSSSSPARP
jgi:hypothetical protein